MSKNSNINIVMYHYTRDLVHSRYPKIKGMDYKLFREQIEYLNDKFNIISMEEMIEAVKNETDLPENAMLLTFDDGYIDNYLYALPVLEEFKVQGSFFIPGKTFVEHKLLDVNKIHYILACADINKLTEDLKVLMDHYRGNEYDYPTTPELYAEYGKSNRWDDADTIFVKRMLQTALPEKLRNSISSELFLKYVGISEEQLAYELYMNEDQIRAMKRHGMHIGVHGYDHYWLGNLPKNEMEKDIDEALDALDEFIARDSWVMNYPYGSYNDNVVEYADKKGACLGFTTEVREADLDVDDRMKLPRFDCNDFK